MGRLPNRLPAVRAVWLYNEVPARRILAVAWLERGASVPPGGPELGMPATVLIFVRMHERQFRGSSDDRG
jgi:hypothetical protein